MNNIYHCLFRGNCLEKVPKIFWIGMLGIFFLCAVPINQLQAFEKETIAFSDPLDGCTTSVPELALQTKECTIQTNYAVTTGEEYTWYKVKVKLTQKLTITAESFNFNVALVAYKNCTEDVLTNELAAIDPVAGSAELELDFTANSDVNAGDYIFIKVKFYHSTYGDVVTGESFNICAHEPALTCGDTFVDSGNTTDDYSPNEDCTVVFCSDDPDSRYIVLDFSTFDLQPADVDGNCLDYLQIFDDGVAVEIDGKNQFCGRDLRGVSITATNHSGCLTAVFKSNGDAIVGAGFEADVRCVSCNITIDTEISACDNNSVNIEVAADGGILAGDLEYAIRGNSVDGDMPFANLVWQDGSVFLDLDVESGGNDIDFYRIIVRDKNNISCRRTKRVKIRDAGGALLATPLIPANIAIVETSADCNGKQGMAEITIEGGKAPYMVTLPGSTENQIEGESPFKFNGLELPLNGNGMPENKTFTVTVMDALGCATSKNFVLAANCLKLDCEALPADIARIPAPNPASTNNPTYICTDNGKNIVFEDIENISFANEEDTLRIYDGQGVNEANLIAEYHQDNLPTSSLYSSSSCVTVLIINASPVNRNQINVQCAACDFTVDVETTNASCMSPAPDGVPNANGIIKFTISGGTHANQYSVKREGDITETWVPAPNGELTLDNLPDGDYYFFIRDNWSLCIERIPVTIGKDNPVEILRTRTTNETCTPGDDGKVDVRVTGGSGVYLYSIDAGLNFVPALAEEDEDNPGVYNFTIEGLEGNTAPGYYEYSLVVKDANHPDFIDACIQDDKRIRIYDDCYAKTCDGFFYDSPDDKHESLSQIRYEDEDRTYIICPDVPNGDQFVTVKFQYININRDDTLRAYNSSAEIDESLLLAKLTRRAGTDNDLTTTEDEVLITATNPSGCLTFVFDTDPDKTTTTNNRGWLAMIQCFEACGMEEANTPIVVEETCEDSEDGSLTLSAVKGSGDYTYNLFRINDPAEADTLDGQPQFNANGTIKLKAGNQTNIDTLPAQDNDGLFTGLNSEHYVYIIEDNVIPNCRIVGFIEVGRLPELKLHVRSPGLACDQTEASITVTPKGGSGSYILKDPFNQTYNLTEGEETVLTGYPVNIAGYEFTLKDAKNATDCYEKVNVIVTNNCRVTCYDNESFSSARPYNGPTGYENYEHFVVTYCPWIDGGEQKKVKANFSLFDTEEDLDVLTIYNGSGTSGTEIGQYSGNNSPGEIISSSPDGCMTFEFRANLVDNNFDGFLAKMTCVENCMLSATTSTTQETACWDVDGDKNGSMTIEVDNPLPADQATYQFRLFDRDGVAISPWKNDNNDAQGNFDDADDLDVDGTDLGDGIIGTYRFDSLATERYIVKIRIKDADGKLIPDCKISVTDTVGIYEDLEIEAEVTNVSCDNGPDGKVCLIVTGGSGQYSYSNTNFTMYDGNPCYEGLGNGQVVTYTVRDMVTGCMAQISDIKIGSDCVQEDFCDLDGYDFFDDEDGTDLYEPDMDERWIFCPTRPDKFIQIDFTKFKTEAGIDILTIKDGDGDGPLVGTYSGENSPGLVRSTTGCLTVEFTSNEVVQKLGWEANVSCFYCPSDFQISGTPAECTGHNGSINVTATASGGYTDYLYALNQDFSDAQSNGVFTGLSGTVTVYAKIVGLEACETSTTIYEQLTYTLAPTDAQCGQNNGSLTVNVSGGSGNYEYAINGGDFQAEKNFTGLAPGSYAVTIKDGDCTKIDGFSIGNNDDGDPVITVKPESRTANVDAGKCDAYVIINELEAEDCEGVTITNDFNGGGANATGTYPKGATTVTYTIEDASGDKVMHEIVVTVIDNEDPFIEGFKPDHPILGGLDDKAIIEVPFGELSDYVFDENDIVVSDNCGSYTVTFQDIDLVGGNECGSGGYFNTFRCVWTATDDANNTSTIEVFLYVLCPPVPDADIFVSRGFFDPIYEVGEEKPFTIILDNFIEGSTTSGRIKFRMTKNSNGFDYEFKPNYSTGGANNSDWEVDSESAGSITFISKPGVVITGGNGADDRSQIVLHITATGAGADANTTIKLFPNSTGFSGGDTNSVNNTSITVFSVQN